jgi:hypothetical protein
MLIRLFLFYFSLDKSKFLDDYVTIENRIIKPSSTIMRLKKRIKTIENEVP